MKFFDIMQLSAGLFFCFSYIPQIIEILKKKSAKDVNMTNYILCAHGYFFAQIYVIGLLEIGTGYMLFITNSIGFILSLTMIYVIKKWGSK